MYFLNKINDLDFGEYVPRSNLPQLIFLTPRTEAKSLPIDYKRINNLYENKWEKLESMINLIHNKDCREISILNYFGERNAKKCYRCDLCKGSAKVHFDESQLKDFKSYLQKKIGHGQVLFDVLHWWPHNKRAKILSMLSVLENERMININGNRITLI